MGKRLTENLSSLYIGAANSLKPKQAKRKIVAYVESYDDISFWRSLLAEYENDKRYFEVMLPSRSSLAKGKKSVLIDFPAFMKLYSEIAYPLFIWSVWFYRQHNLSEFSLLDFCSFVKLDQVSTRHPEKSLEIMSKKVNRKLHELERRHVEALEEIEDMKKEFRTLGVYPDNTYMFIQGHHIMDNVILRLLIPVCTVLRREREQQIHDLALHDIQLHNELTAYQRSQVDIEVVIRKNPHYQSSPLYQMIRRDIEAFLKIAK